jgi:hypothetical protein
MKIYEEVRSKQNTFYTGGGVDIRELLNKGGVNDGGVNGINSSHAEHPSQVQDAPERLYMSCCIPMIGTRLTVVWQAALGKKAVREFCRDPRLANSKVPEGRCSGCRVC